MEVNSSTPGPNQYSANFTQTLKQSPKFSMRGRPKSLSAQNDVPPPGTYDISSKFSSPAFTMKSRTSKYKPEKSPEFNYFPTTYQNNSPKFTLRSRTEKPGIFEWDKKHNAQLSPATYNIVPEVTAKKFTMKSRTGTKVQSTSPGPAAYDYQHGRLKVSRSPPAFTMHSRHADLALKPSSPGPAAYSVSQNLTKKQNPITMHSRTKLSAVCFVDQYKFYGFM